MSASIRAALRDLDVTALKGKKVALVFDIIADEGGGNMAGGRISPGLLLSTGSVLSPVTTTNSAFQVFNLAEGGSNYNNQGSSSGSGSTTVTVVNGSGTNSGNTSGTSNTNGTSSGSNTSNTSASGTSSGTNTSTTNGSGTSASTSSGAGTNTSTTNSSGTNNNTNTNSSSGTNNATTTGTTNSSTTGGYSQGGTSTDVGTSTGTSTTNGSSTNGATSTGSSTNTSTTNGSNTGSNSTTSATTGSNTGANASTTNNTGASTGANTNTSTSTSSTESGTESTSNSSGGFKNNRQTLSSSPTQTTTQTEGKREEKAYSLAYQGIGSYQNISVPKSDAGLLMGLVRNYLLFNGVIPTVPTDPQAEILVYVTVDVFGTVRSRFDSLAYNNEMVRAETSFEISAFDRNGKMVMRPKVANREARFTEHYLFWAGPILTQEKVSKGKGLLVDFTDVDGTKATYPTDETGVNYPLFSY